MVGELATKAVFGGLLVLLFALAAQTLRPQRFACVLGAGPSLALASLTVTCTGKGPLEARRACEGMVAGAVGMVIYCVLATVLMRRWGAVRGAASALAGWFAGALLTGAAVSALPTAAAVAVPGYLRQTQDRPAVECQPRRLRDVTVRQLALRFGFGAGVSLVAGIVTVVAGTLAGGVFLAFPAVLLASLTLTAECHGDAAACDQARG